MPSLSVDLASICLFLFHLLSCISNYLFRLDTSSSGKLQRLEYMC